ncbi:hypothetical protein V5D56_05070 [Cellulosimicrobium sp. PMB13]|uniref:hypothetical protein n=1 Tax=Cellulosimicrobium sp. PMB13 TaxID=3120158 RepID=UPI003F4BD7AE
MRTARRAALPLALASLTAAALVSACSGPGPGEKDTTYDSVADLQSSAKTAGLTCLSFTETDSGSPDVETGTCDDTALLAVFADGVAEEDFVSMLPPTPEIEGEAVLVGPNWAIQGDVDDLEETQAGIGGEMISDR